MSDGREVTVECAERAGWQAILENFGRYVEVEARRYERSGR
jgi:hypothetical protein